MGTTVSVPSIRYPTLYFPLLKQLPGLQYLKRTPGFPFSPPSDFPPIEGFSKNRHEKRTSGKREESDCWNDLCYVFQMAFYLFPFFPCPSFIGISGLHQKLHQTPYRKDLHQDGFLINNDQPSKIFFDHLFFSSSALLNFFIYVKSYHNILCCQG